MEDKIIYFSEKKINNYQYDQLLILGPRDDITLKRYENIRIKHIHRYIEMGEITTLILGYCTENECSFEEVFIKHITNKKLILEYHTYS